MRLSAFFAVPMLLATTATGQRVLSSFVLPPLSEPRAMRPAGDTNGDGVQDFVVLVYDESTPGNYFDLVIASGATGAALHTIAGLQSARDAVGFGDTNLDGRSDIAVATDNTLRVYSGATGALLYALPPGPGVGNFVAVADLGDWNNDGRADFAVATYDSGQNLVRLVQGQNGATLATSASIPNTNVACTLRRIGDVNQDARGDLAIGNLASATVLQTSPMAVRYTTPANVFYSEMRVADLDGNGVAELVLHRNTPAGTGTFGQVEVQDALTGALRVTLRAMPGFATGIGERLAEVGDLNQDGTADLAVAISTPAGPGMRAFSGSTGAELWELNSSTFLGIGGDLCAIGDVDGDGFSDLAILGNLQFGARGWLIVSGRVLADVRLQSGACGAGPFFPRLGATRPILGAVVTIAGDDGPPATNGMLLFSLRPATPTWLGASSCFAWFALGNAAVLQILTAPQWTLTLPVPNVPQLAGIEVAVQSYYAPTNGPLGYDLGNGVWARLGYQ